MKHLSKYFINGLIVMLPFAITAIVVMNVSKMAEDLLGRHLPLQFPGLGLTVIFAIVLLTGWLSSSWILQQLLAFGERLLDSIPVIKFIYSSVKQVSTAMLESQNLFKQAVLVPYPHAGTKALGFIMADLSEPIAKYLPDENVCVFIPLSMNMTAGVNIFLPKKDIILLDITSESALQYILTAGAIMPRGNEPTKA